jgi:hypothetical protein
MRELDKVRTYNGLNVTIYSLDLSEPSDYTIGAVRRAAQRICKHAFNNPMFIVEVNLEDETIFLVIYKSPVFDSADLKKWLTQQDNLTILLDRTHIVVYRGNAWHSHEKPAKLIMLAVKYAVPPEIVPLIQKQEETK